VSVASRISAGTNYYRQRMAVTNQKHDKGLKDKYCQDEYSNLSRVDKKRTDWNGAMASNNKPWGYDPCT
jgi:hypothetical protein